MIDRIAQIHHLEGRKVNSVNGEDRAVSVTPALVGAAAEGHKHAQSDINGLAETVATITNAAETVHATAKATATLQEGVSVVPATTSGIADVEIAGRTLVSLGNSNLEAGKKYVIADPKTKVVVDGGVVAGVGKFTKGPESSRAGIVRVENFEGKVSGSTTENPHIYKYAKSSTLDSPTNAQYEEIPTDHFPRPSSTDGSYSSPSTSVNTEIAQALFSFNLIEAVERNIGKIPASDVSGKVAWLADNVSGVSIDWYGFGRGAGGPKATLDWWSSLWNSNAVNGVHFGNATDRIYRSIYGIYFRRLLQHDGFVHFLAYAEPADVTTSSTIYTDYIELEIELKPDADFHAPRVPLYEVDDASYNNILAAWPADEVIKRYPVVEGMQHLTNPYVMVEGDNLLPPFTEWNLHENTTVISPYELELNSSSKFQFSDMHIGVFPNTYYYFAAEELGAYWISERDVNNEFVKWVGADIHSRDFLTSPSARYLRVEASNGTEGKHTFKNPMLTLGSRPKPFIPKNPSYLYADGGFGAIGSENDVLFKEDAKWKVRKVVEKIDLDGSQGWTKLRDKVGYKRASLSNTFGNIKSSTALEVRKHNGASVIPTDGYDLDSPPDTCYLSYVNGGLNIAASNDDTGFSDANTPSDIDWKRYFNGWKYVDGTTWISVTGNSQTATAQQALDTKPTDYTPYKLSYVLAEPVIEEVSVEGDLKVDGLTQVEVGSGMVVREKVSPAKGGGEEVWYINTPNLSASLLSNQRSEILNVYRNGNVDNGWVIQYVGDYIGYRALIEGNLYDPEAEYTVTYIALDKHKLTTNISDTKFRYPQDFTTSFRDLVTQAEDVATRASVNKNAMLDAYIELQALRGGGN